MAYRHWTKYEVTYLQNNYGFIFAKDIAEHLKRSRESVEKKAAKLGLRSKKPKGNNYKNPHNKGKKGLYCVGENNGNWRKIGEVWTAAGNKYTKNKKGKIVLLRRHILTETGADIEGLNVTHIDGDTLNCNIGNLKTMTNEELAIQNSKNCKDPKLRALRCRMAKTGESFVDLVLKGLV